MTTNNTTATVVATIVKGFGMWQHPIAVKNALCGDGKRRKVRLNQDGQTGRCTVGKTTLKGFISYVGSASCGDVEDYEFIAYSDQSK